MTRVQSAVADKAYVRIDKLQLQHFLMIAGTGGIKTMQIDNHVDPRNKRRAGSRPSPAAPQDDAVIG
ncbi:hypothetical protein GGER_21430 [Serratia rubidaea]